MKKFILISIILLTNILNASVYYLDAGKNQTIHLGESVVLNGLITKGDISSVEYYQWSEHGKILHNMSDDEILYTNYKDRENGYLPKSVGKHILLFNVVKNGRAYSDRITINVKPKLEKYTLNAGPDKVIYEDEFFVLNGLLTNGDKVGIEYYQWIDNNGQILNNMLGDEILYVDYEDRENDYQAVLGKHTLTFQAIANNGKIYSDSMIVVVKKRGSSSKDAFITTWKTNLKNGKHQITIPTYGSREYDYNIDWGDGKTEQHITGNTTHFYQQAGNYKIKITGTFSGFGVYKYRDNLDLLSVDQWGTQTWKTMKDFFSRCILVEGKTKDKPDLSLVTDASGMFAKAKKFNQNINNWDVSNIKDMSNMFYDARVFNQSLENWDVSNSTDMSRMFYNAHKFNGKIENWDVSHVRDMSYMFGFTNKFNQNISNWDVSNVTNMSNMFWFNPIFNKNIGNWDVSKVVNMYGMFDSAFSFNQDISNWDVSHVVTMSRMFDNAKSFNQDISQWDISNVNSVVNMFHNAASFNQDIGNWDVSHLKSMHGLFNGAKSFNQDISGWDVSNVKSFASFLSDDSTFSIKNYDKLLIAWSKLNLQHNVRLYAGRVQYTPKAKKARAILVNKFNWTIIDGDILE